MKSIYLIIIVVICSILSLSLALSVPYVDMSGEEGFTVEQYNNISQNVSNYTTYNTTYINEFDQSLNTTDNVQFNDINITGYSYFANELRLTNLFPQMIWEDANNLGSNIYTMLLDPSNTNGFGENTLIFFSDNITSNNFAYTDSGVEQAWFFVNGTSGNVGIGQISTDKRLDVNGSIIADNICYSNGTNCQSGDGEPNWNANFTNMIIDCPNGNYSYGMYVNGTWKCKDDEQGEGSGEPNWNANYTTFLTHIDWATATNGTLALASQLNDYLLISNWNATNTSYYLASNPSGYISEETQWNNNYSLVCTRSELNNGSYFNVAETDPIWSANYSTFLTHATMSRVDTNVTTANLHLHNASNLTAGVMTGNYGITSGNLTFNTNENGLVMGNARMYWNGTALIIKVT